MDEVLFKYFFWINSRKTRNTSITIAFQPKVLQISGGSSDYRLLFIITFADA
jgi:hypothetical protein